jgi:hypothetical protein
LETTSAELKSNGVQLYQQELIGVLQWAVELGRVVDILLEALLMSMHMAMPREQGHLQQLY